LAAHREALAALGAVPGRELSNLPHGTRARAAGVLECLQAPPTRSGTLVHFLLTEDESGLLQSTIFERLYRDSGSLLYQTGAFLLDGRVEQHPRRGFSFVVERIADLAAALNEVGDKTRRVPREAALPDSAERAPRSKRRRKAG
jgi:error-prone DNA polymerase